MSGVRDDAEKLGWKLADLAEVELSVLLVGDALDLEEGGVGVGVALAALVAEDAALAVESAHR